MKQKPNAIIHLERQTKDGVLYLSSKDLPGLWLWGKDPERVFESVVPTITKLYELNEGLAVDVRESCQRGGLVSRWFGRDRACDTFEIYYIDNKLGKSVTHGRSAVE